MYQDTTEKSVETKREISQQTFTLLGGQLYPLFWGNMAPKKSWRTLYLVGKCGPTKKILADPLLFKKIDAASGPFIWG